MDALRISRNAVPIRGRPPHEFIAQIWRAPHQSFQRVANTVRSDRPLPVVHRASHRLTFLLALAGVSDGTAASLAPSSAPHPVEHGTTKRSSTGVLTDSYTIVNHAHVLLDSVDLVLFLTVNCRSSRIHGALRSSLLLRAIRELRGQLHLA